MSGALTQTLIARARAAGVIVPTTSELAQLQAYFELLERWNQRINLTALPLGGAADGTIDRLFVEPLAAAAHVPTDSITWIDVGSGGGSPAIPLKIVRPAARLTMVESRERKSAFLREAVRALELRDVDVYEGRFEALIESLGSSPPVDLLTIRAVRVDVALFQLCRRALTKGGRLLLFQSASIGSVQLAAGLKRRETVQLTDTPAYLDILEAT